MVSPTLAMTTSAVPFTAATTSIPPSKRKGLQRSQTYPATLHDHTTVLLEQFQHHQAQVQVEVPASSAEGVEANSPSFAAVVNRVTTIAKFSRSQSMNRIAAIDHDAFMNSTPPTPVVTMTRNNGGEDNGTFLTSSVDDELGNTNQSYLRIKPSSASSSRNKIPLSPEQSRRQLLRTCRKQLQNIRELEVEVRRLRARSRKDIGKFKQTIAEWTEIIHQRRESRRST